MARTTVEDCINNCDNHFELVLGVVLRSKKLLKGEFSELHQDADKAIVQSLREISQGKYIVDLNAEIERNLDADEALTTGQQSLAPETPASDQPNERT